MIDKELTEVLFAKVTTYAGARRINSNAPLRGSVRLEVVVPTPDGWTSPDSELLWEGDVGFARLQVFAAAFNAFEAHLKFHETGEEIKVRSGAWLGPDMIWWVEVYCNSDGTEFSIFDLPLEWQLARVERMAGRPSPSVRPD
ncbi:MAG: hypothetical protein KF842_04050 [Caulobacter sp.]|nr:hypothetical protein [Caulobacter sp.]